MYNSLLVRIKGKQSCGIDLKEGLDEVLELVKGDVSVLACFLQDAFPHCVRVRLYFFYKVSKFLE